MARIFISYSRADSNFIDELVPLLESIYPNDDIWFDRHISGGEDWWQMILDEINRCDIFIYLLSNDSLESEYCQAEFAEALRLQKPCVPVIVRAKTDVNRAPDALRPELKKRNWIDLSLGFKDAKANARLYATLNKYIRAIPPTPPQPLAPQPIPQPQVTLTTQTQVVLPKPSMIMMVIALIVVIFGAILIVLNQGNQPATSTPTPTDNLVAQITADLSTPSETLTTTPSPTLTSEPSPTPTDEPSPTEQPTNTTAPSETPSATITLTPSDTPTQPDAMDIAAQIIQTENAGTETQSALDKTATATLWTPTFTPDATQTAFIEAQMTQQAINTAVATLRTATQSAIETQVALSFTPTFTPTSTPTITLTPSHTPTSTLTPSNTPTHTPTPSATPTIPAGYVGGAKITANEQWIPVEQEFDGVMMVLVPAGCFMMGSETGEDDEKPVHQQCFDEPFWIDKYEVTQAQFTQLGGQKASANYFTGDDLPVEKITWFEARDYCEQKRGGRLPTEAEWEYAARGPNNLIYPWGNDFVADNVVYEANADETAPVGSRVGGVSWVGAMDMSGNVWEWVSSLYEPYEYDAEDGRERDTGNDTSVLRVLRGGSWVNDADLVRASNRNRNSPSYEDNINGFRCSRSYDF